MNYFVDIDLQASLHGPIDRRQLAALLRAIARQVEGDDRFIVHEIADGHGTTIGRHGFLGSDFEDADPVPSLAQGIAPVIPPPPDEVSAQAQPLSQLEPTAVSVQDRVL